MPSVASEHSAIQHTRHQQPANRSRTDSAEREPSSPFAELLDSAAPANEPPPAPRNTRAQRSDTTRTAENRRNNDKVEPRDDAKPAREARDTGAADEARTSEEATKAARSGEESAAATGTDDSGAATDTTETAETTLDAELAAALAALVGDTAQPGGGTEAAITVTPLPVAANATATDLAAAAEAAAQSVETPAADALAALQAAEDQAEADKADAKGEVKAGPKKAAAKDDAKALRQTELDLADTKVAAAQKDAGKDGEAGNNAGEKPGQEVRQVAKPDAERPEGLQSNHGAEVSAVARQGATNEQSSIASSASADPAAGAAAQAAAPAAAAAQAHPTALTSTHLQAHIQAQLQAGADASPAVPLGGVAVEIASQALAGKNRFEIRLDPPELGRIDVKLDIDGDGNATTRLVVERSDTLDLLKRDASQLERALQQAGLKTSDNALEFSLRQEAFQQDDDQSPSNGAQIVLPDEDTPIHAQRQSYGRLLGTGGGLDIRV